MLISLCITMPQRNINLGTSTNQTAAIGAPDASLVIVQIAGWSMRWTVPTDWIATVMKLEKVKLVVA